MAKKSEVAVREEAGGAVIPATGWGGAGGTGFEGTTSDDYVLPFLKLLQKMSPEVDSDSGSYVEGAKPGMFYDTATGEIFDSVDVIPCMYKHAIVEWAGDEPGSGFVAQHEPGYEQSFPKQVKEGRETGKWAANDGHVLQDTRYFFCLRVNEDGETLPCVVSMTSTQIKKARGWMSRMQALRTTDENGDRVQAPMFSNIWRLSSVPEENNRGQAFRGYKVDRVREIVPADEALMVQSVVDAVAMFRQSSANVKPPAGDASTGGKSGDEIPF